MTNDAKYDDALSLIQRLLSTSGMEYADAVADAKVFLKENMCDQEDVEKELVLPNIDLYTDIERDSAMMYFVVHPCGDCNIVTVVDLLRSCAWEKGDWMSVDENVFSNHKLAILYAREIARLNNLEYSPFSSRHNSSLSEQDA